MDVPIYNIDFFFNERQPIKHLNGFEDDIFILCKLYLPQYKSIDIGILLTLINNSNSLNVDELKTQLKRERSTIQKRLNTLIDNKIIIRTKQNLRKGFKYLYTSNINLYEVLNNKIELKYKYEKELLKTNINLNQK